jgi:hypothetical protein
MRHHTILSVLAATAALGIALALMSDTLIVHAESHGETGRAHAPAEFSWGDPRTAEKHPQGCVSCHDGAEVETIGALLSAMRHRNVDQRTETVPNDCAECHSEEGGHSLLSEFSHIVHFEAPERNAFLRDHDGNCLHCHALDAETGEVTMKSGPKNW